MSRDADLTSHLGAFSARNCYQVGQSYQRGSSVYLSCSCPSFSSLSDVLSTKLEKLLVWSILIGLWFLDKDFLFFSCFFLLNLQLYNCWLTVWATVISNIAISLPRHKNDHHKLLISVSSGFLHCCLLSRGLKFFIWVKGVCWVGVVESRGLNALLNRFSSAFIHTYNSSQVMRGIANSF